VAKKKRQYFKTLEDGVAAPVHGYVVKWVEEIRDLSDMEIKNEGPFVNKNTAESLLQDYLKSGICSWVVSYHD
jgi:hypothetical protein